MDRGCAIGDIASWKQPVSVRFRGTAVRFVHIIEINDPRNPLLDSLTREQLWRGLLRRVERPVEFLPQLKHCLIVMRGDSTLARELDFGDVIVRDRVRLVPMQKVTFDTEARPNVPAGNLIIAIEEHGADHLQLRFTYTTHRERSADAKMEQQYDRIVQSAYLQADIDSVKVIRALADRGEL
jgi:hypothetical protein